MKTRDEWLKESGIVAIRDQTWHATNECWNAALEDSMKAHNLSVSEIDKDEIRYAIRITRSLKQSRKFHGIDLNAFTEKVDSLYLTKLCKLETYVIENIIDLDDKKITTRAPKTIERLLQELARRYLLEDSNE